MSFSVTLVYSMLVIFSYYNFLKEQRQEIEWKCSIMLLNWLFFKKLNVLLKIFCKVYWFIREHLLILKFTYPSEFSTFFNFWKLIKFTEFAIYIFYFSKNLQILLNLLKFPDYRLFFIIIIFFSFEWLKHLMHFFQSSNQI